MTVFCQGIEGVEVDSSSVQLVVVGLKMKTLCLHPPSALLVEPPILLLPCAQITVGGEANGWAKLTVNTFIPVVNAGEFVTWAVKLTLTSPLPGNRLRAMVPILVTSVG